MCICACTIICDNALNMCDDEQNAKDALKRNDRLSGHSFLRHLWHFVVVGRLDELLLVELVLVGLVESNPLLHLLNLSLLTSNLLSNSAPKNKRTN